MQRYNSKASLAGSTTSRINGTVPTHVIMQSDADSRGVIQYIVLSTENLVNFGRPPKINDMITYKADLRSRGTSRGKIILFGSEDDCAEQVQVLSEASDLNDVDVSGGDSTAAMSGLQGVREQSHDDGFDRSSEEWNKENMASQAPSIHSVDKQVTKEKKGCDKQRSQGNNRLINSTQNRVQINRSTTQSKAHVLKKVVRTMPSTASSTSFDMRSPSMTGTQTTTPTTIRRTVHASTPLTSTSVHPKRKQQFISCESTSSDGDEVDNIVRAVDPIDGNPAMVDKDYLVKKYTAMQRKYHLLEIEHDRLVIAHQALKANSLPMPCDVGRKWLSSISKLVNPKQLQSNTDFIASELGIEKSSMLASCIRDTASNTTRQVVKLLYSPIELENGRGTDVSDQHRKLIRDFVEQEHGVINGRAFREAINGVFRSRAHNKKQKTPTSSARKSASLVSNHAVGGSASTNKKKAMPPQLDQHIRGFDEDEDEDEDF